MKITEINQGSPAAPATHLGGCLAIPKHLAVLALGVIWCAFPAQGETRPLSRNDLRDKIQGGWAGQMIGVSFGAPTEFRAMAKINEAELKWSPERVSNAIGQDDLYVEMTFAKVMD